MRRAHASRGRWPTCPILKALLSRGQPPNLRGVYSRHQPFLDVRGHLTKVDTDETVTLPGLNGAEVSVESQCTRAIHGGAFKQQPRRNIRRQASHLGDLRENVEIRNTCKAVCSDGEARSRLEELGNRRRPCASS